MSSNAPCRNAVEAVAAKWPSLQIGVADGARDVDRVLRVFAAVNTFDKSLPEIRQAILRENTDKYDYRDAYVPCIRDPATGDVTAAAIVVAKRVNKHTVHELIWAAVLPEARGLSLGSILFQFTHGLATRTGASAVMVESTICALPFWLSQSRRHAAARAVLRDQPIRRDIGVLHKSFSATTNRKIAAKLAALLSPGKFAVKAFPPRGLEPLYTDTVFRNKKGKPTASSIFHGTPFRYQISQAAHVWFPIRKGVKKRLGKLVMKPSCGQPLRIRKTTVPTAAAAAAESKTADGEHSQQQPGSKAPEEESKTADDDCQQQ